MSNVVLPTDANNTGKFVATTSIVRDGVTEVVQLVELADPISGNGASVTAPGIGGANALVVQGVASGVPMPVTPSANPPAGSVLLLPTTTQTGNGNGNAFNVAIYKSLLLCAVVTAESGTGSPTLTISLQAQDPLSANWVTVFSFAGITATTNGVLASVGPGLTNAFDFGAVVRIAYTITGTTPSFTFSVSAQGK